MLCLFAITCLCPKMRLPLTISCHDASSSTSANSVLVVQGELCLVELNGTLTASNDDGSIAGEKVGKLDLCDPNKPVLTIGHHRLVGKQVKLDNPMAILKHTLAPRTATPSLYSASSSPPSSSHSVFDLPSSPIQHNIASSMNTRVDGCDDMKSNIIMDLDVWPSDTEEAEPHPAKRQALSPSKPPLLATPGPGAALHPSSASSCFTKPPATPLNVTELKSGKHEIVGIIRRKLVFSKRPEPIVHLIASDDECD